MMLFNSMKRLKKKNNFLEEMKEKAISWFWVVLFISSIFFLRALLVEMHTETARLSEERERFEVELEKEREKSKKLYQEFYAELNENIRRVIESINKGEIPQQNCNPSKNLEW